MLVRMRKMSHDAKPMRMKLMLDFICGLPNTTMEMTLPKRPNTPTKVNSTPGKRKSKTYKKFSLSSQLVTFIAIFVIFQAIFLSWRRSAKNGEKNNLYCMYCYATNSSNWNTIHNSSGEKSFFFAIPVSFDVLQNTQWCYSGGGNFKAIVIIVCCFLFLSRHFIIVISVIPSLPRRLLSLWWTEHIKYKGEKGKVKKTSLAFVV